MPYEVSPCGRFGIVAYRRPDQGDTDLFAAVREIQSVELPEFRTVARLSGVGYVLCLAWISDGQDLYALTNEAEVLDCRISGAPPTGPSVKLADEGAVNSGCEEPFPHRN